MVLIWILSGIFIIFLCVVENIWNEFEWVVIGIVLIGTFVPERMYFEHSLQGDDVQGIVKRVFERYLWIKYYFYCYGIGLIALAYYSLFGEKDWFENISTTMFLIVILAWLAPIICFRQYELFIRAGEPQE